jgi:uncharacterized protein
LKILIADTSPVISLLLIQQFGLLEKLFEEVFIPPAVWDELNQRGPHLIYKEEMDFLSGKIIKPEKTMSFPTIDKGETESIALYIELNATYLLIDDKKGRQVAEENSINCIGTLTVLISAKRKGLISGLKYFFEMLLANKRFYTKETLNQILAAENEPLL